jgi:hypothetical protein
VNTHEVLVAARNLIDREGWKQAKSRYEFGVGPGRCAYIALWDATMEGDCVTLVANRATDVLAEFIPRSGGTSSGDLYDWNDAPGRTKEEVLALFDEAIAATAPEPDLSLTVGRASFREPVKA